MASQRVQTSRQGDGESSGASNDGGGVLPRDVLYEILLRVPAWVLCRFRTVCESWCSLLSGRPFIAAHEAHHRHRDPLFAVTCVFGKAVSSTGGDGEYKVLSLSRASDPPYDTQFCEVLTVDSHGTWRVAPGPPVAIKTLHRETLVASGVVYRLVDRTIGWTIAAFDLEAEQWRPDLLQGPASRNWVVRRSLAEVNSRLAAVSSTDSAFDMWLLMGSGAGPVVQATQSSHIVHRAEVLVPGGHDGRVAFCLRSPYCRDGTLWMYDPRTKMCTHLADCLTIGVGVYSGNLLRQV
ncbi:hypothetical protein SETIT_8G083300v2 [Setaria italica]|uniref:F-box domain-containing protein n=1 Tax=Setaria italica TaxID=4555 RepID=K3ZNI8_SETIT|nr:hypothetical protein SETIT_8G083300v2 [Setaria italica]